MADISTHEFLEKYGHFLVQCWGLPALKQRFKREPEKVLKEFGLDTEGAKIAIKAPGSANVPKAMQTPESQVQLWNEGKKSGKIDFYFPEEPPKEGAGALELSEDELMAVAGGGFYACCCCCPCCCC
jgi:hypothetical protein